MYGSPTSTSLSIVLDPASHVGLGSASGVTSKLTVGGACTSVSMGSGDSGREVGEGGRGFGPALQLHAHALHNHIFIHIL